MSNDAKDQDMRTLVLQSTTFINGWNRWKSS
jgi:hypothetical protein